MLNRKAVAGVVLAVGVFSGGYVFGQDAAKKDFKQELGLVLYNLTKGTDAAGELEGLYSSAVGDSAKTRILVDHSVASYYEHERDRTSDALVSLQAIQVLQNQRIIELLEQQKKSEK